MLTTFANSIKKNILNSIPWIRFWYVTVLLLLCERARIHLIDIIELFSPEYHFMLFILFV